MFKTCTSCGGSGKGVGIRERQADGWIGTTSTTCNNCNGSGKVYDATAARMPPPPRSQSTAKAKSRGTKSAPPSPKPRSGAANSVPSPSNGQAQSIDGIIALAGAGGGAFAIHSVTPDNSWAILIGAAISGVLAWKLRGPIKVVILLAIIGFIIWLIAQSQG